jgi:hypothetical protein
MRFVPAGIARRHNGVIAVTTAATGALRRVACVWRACHVALRRATLRHSARFRSARARSLDV